MAYFDGKHSLEEIQFITGLERRDVRRLLTDFKEDVSNGVKSVACAELIYLATPRSSSSSCIPKLLQGLPLKLHHLATDSLRPRFDFRHLTALGLDAGAEVRKSSPDAKVQNLRD